MRTMLELASLAPPLAYLFVILAGIKFLETAELICGPEDNIGRS